MGIKKVVLILEGAPHFAYFTNFAILYGLLLALTRRTMFTWRVPAFIIAENSKLKIGGSRSFWPAPRKSVKSILKYSMLLTDTYFSCYCVLKFENLSSHAVCAFRYLSKRACTLLHTRDSMHVILKVDVLK